IASTRGARNKLLAFSCGLRKPKAAGFPDNRKSIVLRSPKLITMAVLGLVTMWIPAQRELHIDPANLPKRRVIDTPLSYAWADDPEAAADDEKSDAEDSRSVSDSAKTTVAQ